MAARLARWAADTDTTSVLPFYAYLAATGAFLENHRSGSTNPLGSPIASVDRTYPGYVVPTVLDEHSAGQRQIATTPLPTCLGSRTRATRVRKSLPRLELHRSNLCQAPRGKASHPLVCEHRRLDIGEPEAQSRPNRRTSSTKAGKRPVGHENEVVAQRAHRRRAQRLPRTGFRAPAMGVDSEVLDFRAAQGTGGT